jgi:hypothetical protein
VIIVWCLTVPACRCWWSVLTLATHVELGVRVRGGVIELWRSFTGKVRDSSLMYKHLFT